jgi:hypothetical protein
VFERKYSHPHLFITGIDIDIDIDIHISEILDSIEKGTGLGDKHFTHFVFFGFHRINTVVSR